MIKLRAAALAAGCFMLASAAVAQDQTAFLAKALGALQQQRNQAMDQAVNSQAEAGVLRDTIAALQAENAKLKADLAAAKKEPEQKP